MALLARTFSVGAPLLVIFLVALVLFIVCLVDMVRRPSWQWKQAGSNKVMWLTLEIILFVLFGLLSIVSSIIYLVAARPKLVAAERAGERGQYEPSGWGNQGYGQYDQQGQYGRPSGGYGESAPPGAYGVPTPTDYGGGPPAYPGSNPYGSAPYAQAQEAPHAGQISGSEVPASWQPDPSRRHELRYWDGNRWTEHVSDAGRQSTDPPVA